jgi:integrase
MAVPKKRASGLWGIQIEVKGVRDSGSFATKAQATAWAARRATELRTASTTKPASTKTLGDALREYAEKVSPTKRGESKELIRLSAFERQTLPIKSHLCDVTTADLVRWRDSRLAVNARGSVLRDMTLLGHVFEVARREWQWIPANPMKDVRRPQEPDHRTRVITGAEIRGMLRSLGHGGPVRSVSQAIAMAFLLALATGMRAGELCALRWGDAYPDFVRLHVSKTGAGRDVPLSPYARRLVKRLVGWDAVSLLSIQPQTLDALFRRARDRAALAGFTFHDSRHTAATRMARRLDVLDLCKVFGWRSTTQALAYYNPTASQIAGRL